MAAVGTLSRRHARFAAVFVALVLAPLVAGAVGRIGVSLQLARPVLQWSNHVGEAYVIETATNLTSQIWQQRAVLTTDAAMAVWADDGTPQQAVFFRVRLSTNPAPFQSLQQALQRACTNQHITGASAAAVLPQSGFWLGTCGTSDGTVPIRPQTPFEVASITKTFIAAIVLKLVEDGQLSLSDTIGEWLPSLNDPNVSPAVTVHQLLSHRSGIYNFGDDVPFQLALFADLNRYWQPEDVFDYVHAPYFAPDQGGQYSNTGYVLLGMIIRNVTGRSVDVQLQSKIFGPAGLRSSVLGARTNWNGELAHPHIDITGDGIPEDFGNDTQTAILTSFWTSGAVVSTPADLARFSTALFEGGLLSASSLTQMRTFQPVVVGSTTIDYGLGLIRYNILGHEHWAHSGGLFGEYSWFSYCPDTRVSLAVTYNYTQTVLTGASLPSELLVVLSTLTNPVAQTGVSGSPPAESLKLNLVP
jgi:D-alanyl-D-alanine carboxypeptidase